jgi:hypothetical protein
MARIVELQKRISIFRCAWDGIPPTCCWEVYVGWQNDGFTMESTSELAYYYSIAYCRDNLHRASDRS